MKTKRIDMTSVILSAMMLTMFLRVFLFIVGIDL